MISRLFIFFCCIIQVACGSGNRKPRGVLPEEKMQVILWDIMRADQFLNDYVFNRDTSLDKRKESIKLYRQIFNLHKVTKEEFQESYHFYLEDPARFRVILDSAGARRRSMLQRGLIDSVVKDGVVQPRAD